MKSTKVQADSPAYPILSIVIPTYNRMEVLVGSLEEMELEGSKASFEVIVVCDGCTDDTARALNHRSWKYPCKIVEQSNSGSASARNHGAKLANAEFLLFIDDDMRADGGLIDSHVYALQKGSDVVVGRMDFDRRSPDTILADYVKEWSTDFDRQLNESGVQSGFDILSGHFSIRKELFNKIGGFQESYNSGGRYGNEDLDFGIRLFNQDVVIVYENSAVTRQYYGVTARQKFRQTRDLGAVDIIFSESNDDAAKFYSPEIKQVGHIKYSWLNWLSRKWPRFTYAATTPVRLILCRLIDQGSKHIKVHRMYGMTQALAYRAGQADQRYNN